MGQKQCCCTNDPTAAGTDMVETQAIATIAAKSMEEEEVAPSAAVAMEEQSPDKLPFAAEQLPCAAEKVVLREVLREVSTVKGPNPNEIVAVFTRTEPGQVMGLHADQGNQHNLVVHSITEDGLIGQWNKANPDQAVKKGDMIVAVNGWIGDSKGLHEELKTANSCECRIIRKPERKAAKKKTDSSNTSSPLQTDHDKTDPRVGTIPPKPKTKTAELMSKRAEMQKNWNAPRSQAPDHSKDAKKDKAEAQKIIAESRAKMQDKWDHMEVEDEHAAPTTGDQKTQKHANISENIEAALAVIVQKG